jgi:NAD(P)-dependent dehydrogenase (short-subunit alcohol dehydrogenase family)
MSDRGAGRLLFVSSILGRIALPTRGAYVATKWALEALVETLAMEVGPFGVDVSLLEPGAVASGALDAPRRYFGDTDAYAALDTAVAGARGRMITVEETAAAIADTVEADTVPLRIPVGDPARKVLAARRDASDTVPFELVAVAR